MDNTNLGGAVMADRICSVDTCTRPRFAREWCQMHYTRWLRHGDPNAPSPFKVRRARSDESLLDRIKAKTVVQDGCWVWQGTLNSKGYGSMKAGKMRRVHRLAYELVIGPIPAGLVIDHLCKNKACCNPAHLEPVTSGENTRRYHRERAGLPRVACE